MNSWIKTHSLALLPILSLVAGAPRAAFAEDRDDRAAVYTTTNAAAGNELVVFARGADGSLAAAGTFATGGAGTGKGLGSQGAIAIADDWLFTVNAGSNDVSTFSLASGSPVLVARTPSGGSAPISLTVRDGLLYVLNTGESANVTGFWIGDDGALHAIAGSTQPVRGAGAVEVGFDPRGETLVVAEKVANQIETYAIDRYGRAEPPVAHASSGETPFGFDFTPRGDLVISEAFGGAPGAAAVSSYALRRGSFTPVSASVPDDQTAACWLAVSRDGRHAFTANAGSGNVSAYDVNRDGTLSLVGSGVAGTTGAGSHPIDLAFAGRDRFLYVLASGTGAIDGFGVHGGALTAVGAVGGLPASVTGLAAR